MTDVIVIGGGIAGLTAALAVQAEGLTVTVIEKGKHQSLPESDIPTGRVYALHQASVTYLTALNVYPLISEQHKAPFDQMALWDENACSTVHLKAKDHALETLGSNITHEALFNALSQQCDIQNITILDEREILSYEYDIQNNLVTLKDSQDVSYVAQAVIAADGAQSGMKSLLGVSSVSQAEGQSAIVATLSLERTHESTAYQQFTAEGIVAFLPLANKNLVSLVFSCEETQASRWMEYTEDSFEGELRRLTSNYFGKIVLKSPRVCFPLRSMKLMSYVAQGCYFVADAAHVIHPLAGQGLNLGLMDIKSLVRAISMAKVKGLSLTDHTVVRQYERDRKGQNALMSALMTSIRKTTMTKNPLIKMTRSVFAKGFNSCSILQRLIIQYANGQYLNS